MFHVEENIFEFSNATFGNLAVEKAIYSDGIIRKYYKTEPYANIIELARDRIPEVRS